MTVGASVSGPRVCFIVGPEVGTLVTEVRLGFSPSPVESSSVGPQAAGAALGLLSGTGNVFGRAGCSS